MSLEQLRVVIPVQRMNPGRLNKVITLQDSTEVEDDYEGFVKEWSDLATVWARVRPLRGKELIAAQAAQSKTEVEFYVRYRVDLTTAQRVVYGGNNYDITSIINVGEENVELLISAMTGMSEG